MARGEPDDLAEELLIDLAEDVGGHDGELVGAVGVVQAAQDGLQHLVVNGQVEGHLVSAGASPLRLEMEEPGIVAVVRLDEQALE